MPRLNWLTRSHDIKAAGQVAYRILQPLDEGLYGAADNENLLIQGDNLDALKSLLPFYANRVKCVVIDPPYNTRKDFNHYQDNLKHAQWLKMMYPRLELLRELLAEDGSIWAIIDDDEGHYLKVLMDEIFGRKNFVANVVWQKKHSPANDSKTISDTHDHIFVYAKDKPHFQVNLYPRTEKHDKLYKNLDNDPRGPWASMPLQAKTPSKKYIYGLRNPNQPDSLAIWPPSGSSWQYTPEKYEQMVQENRIWFGKEGTNVPRQKKFLSEVRQGITPVTIWRYEEVGNNQQARLEAKALSPDNVFTTPKPEKLLQRILHIATQPGDLVLDSFLGSGTTTAVAHKMKRNWIGIESGDHAKTHCLARLKKVIAGEQGGISKAVNWHGGGGFRFLRLGAEVFLANGNLHPKITFSVFAAHLWFSATRTPFIGNCESPFLGIHDGIGYALLYNGSVRDKKVSGDNILDQETLARIRSGAPNGFDGRVMVYANDCSFDETRMDAENLEFKRVPYEVNAVVN